MEPNELPQNMRTAASAWRVVLSQEELATTALPTDHADNTALQHAAQVEQNILLVTDQIKTMLKKKNKTFARTYTETVVEEEIQQQAQDLSKVRYSLAEKAGILADILERSAESYAATATFEQNSVVTVEQLAAGLSGDMNQRLLLVEQGYEQLAEDD